MRVALFITCFNDTMFSRTGKAVVRLPVRRFARVFRLPAPLAGWTEMRDAPAVPAQSFRDWWRARQRPEGGDKA